jgi:hypothetical protein
MSFSSYYSSNTLSSKMVNANDCLPFNVQRSTFNLHKNLPRSQTPWPPRIGLLTELTLHIHQQRSRLCLPLFYTTLSRTNTSPRRRSVDSPLAWLLKAPRSLRTVAIWRRPRGPQLRSPVIQAHLVRRPGSGIAGL